jgi:hypothetical protein
MAQDWDIKPRAKGCSTCEKQFEAGEHYWSALSRGDAGFERADYCTACWPKVDEASLYSDWQGTFVPPPAKDEEALKKETAESLLRRLIEEEDGEQVDVIFILAVMLERKKILIERDVQFDRDDEMLRVYEHKLSGETFLIADPQLQLDALEVVQQKVVDMLGIGEGKPADPPATQTSEATPELALESPPPQA